MILRVVLYCLGLATVSLGIVLCKKSDLGISPISTIPYVLEQVVPLTFGQLTMVFHFLNTGAQLIMNREKKEIWKILMQLPVALGFAVVIDFFGAVISVDSPRILWQIMLLAASVPTVALGMILMIQMELFQNPPDGTVRLLSLRFGKELGTVKNIYDIICVLTSVALSLVLLGKVVGFGIATVVTAIGVGRCVRLFKGLGVWLHRIILE
ncbi:MAG: DUF6198 family protein [Oscillospiraceae bacterium]|nr:DUF6198 family protein [Oscillospiraceae bacterium]